MLMGDLKPFIRDSARNTAPVSSTVTNSFVHTPELRSYVICTESRTPSRISTSRTFCSNVAASATDMWKTVAVYWRPLMTAPSCSTIVTTSMSGRMMSSRTSPAANM